MAEPGRRCARCGDSFGPDVLFCPRDGLPLTNRRTELTEDPYLGLVVDGLRLDQLVGIGAMGRVYRAHEAAIERDVAVKILHRELLRNAMLVARFEREARAAARLAHPNVIGVHRLGELPELAPNVGGEAFMVLEYLDGISMRSALAAAGGALPLPRALHVVLQICDAVGEAHARSIVHRDLKPDNVMLVRRGDDPDFVKVLDFGVARFAESERELFTQAGAVLGTARYISPEGARGEPVGAPGDVYSITTMLFEALCGVTPFDGESPVAILVRQTSETAADVRSIARGSYVPPAIAALVARNLGKDPALRSRDARELGRALVAAAHESGLSPEDLLPRSTLLGTRPALRLASLERTKSMPLGGSASGTGPRGTEFLEPEQPPEPFKEAAVPAPEAPSAAATRTPAPASKAPAPPGPTPVPTSGTPAPSHRTPAPAGQTPAPASRSVPPGPSQSESESRASTVDATLTDSRWDSSPPPGPTPGERRRAALRRGSLIAACFVAGAAVALLAASGLGVFDDPAPEPGTYVTRARAALARGAILSPPHENVRDITRAALGVWPKQPELVAVRSTAAQRLLEQARALGPEQRERALELLRAAGELDPESSDVRSLAVELAAKEIPEPARSAPSATPSARKLSKPTPRPAASSSAAAQPEPAPSAASPGVVAEPAPSAGRWL